MTKIPPPRTPRTARGQWRGGGNALSPPPKAKNPGPSLRDHLVGGPILSADKSAPRRATLFLSPPDKLGSSRIFRFSSPLFNLASEYRDEDREAPAGFESKAERAREFAAKMTMQAYALLAAAEGAINAYKEITGEAWKAYVAPNEQSVERRSAAAELSAFG